VPPALFSWFVPAYPQTGEFIDSEQELWWPIVREVNKQK
jgi:hypothetical protein